ncbi:hypothetical protein B0H16DRAFT_1900256 [Mycena metata]|uniref:Uncharacterized protein n=1 Tax=Mycena metata TaxID=1033252 RepID=A0AAD7H582_9AGAR|nr:hypothetical protein B0H16DRAFT_1900256 [Mycena metata]
MNYTVDSGLFDHSWFVLSEVVINACLELVLYGIYLVLFILAIYTLAHRITAGKKLLLGYIWAMAVFGTAQLVLSLVEPWIAARFVEVLVKQDVTGDFTSQPELVKLALLSRSLTTAQGIIFAGNNLVMDSLLLYRCFAIWGSDWRLVVFPGILMACTFVIGCVAIFGPSGPTATLFHLPYVFAALTNLVLVVLIGSRIWWIRQDARVVAGDGLRKRYDTVIVMVLESGAVYCVVSVLLAIFGNPSNSGGVIFGILVSIAIHTVNIVPTLIIVRVGLGQNIEDAGKTPPTKEARDTRRKPRADFSAHRKMSPLLPVFYIKASEDTLTA